MCGRGRQVVDSTTWVGVSDDEGDDADYSESTFEKIQAPFGQLSTEPSKF